MPNNAMHLSRLNMIIFALTAHCGQVMASVGLTVRVQFREMQQQEQ
jgi:hypothetical protein